MEDQDPDVLARYHSSISAMGHESQWSGGAQVFAGHPRSLLSVVGVESQVSVNLKKYLGKCMYRIN